MSSPKMNLPMLSDYLLGEVISSHDGVSCYPAIRRGTDEKYIVKVISIPASRSKLDALLLTGALSGKEAALDYFMTLSKDILNQTDILQKLSHQEGFVPYLDGQILPMEDDTGYHVYLLGTYKHSLDRILRTDVLTHADVANLGLDLCAALAACRRSGYLYVDLKPGNIFRDSEQGFRIGDVGFIALPSLKYASLPEKYRSSYCAPELADDMAVINPTVDIYALGLVLYQAYNGGVLPFEGNAPAEILPPPIYADYEMAEIILKACHPDPSQRWQEPTKMAHALIDYLQTYGAPEEPIIPPVLDHAEDEDAQPQEEPFLPEADPQQLQQEMDALENADPDELAFLSGLTNDETAPSEENAADVPDDVMTEELSLMFAQADELIAHDLPEPPVAPEPVFAPMPEPIVLEAEAEQEEEPVTESQTEESAGEAASQESPEPESVAAEETEAAPASPAPDAPAETALENPIERIDFPKPAFRFPWRIAATIVMIALLVVGFFVGRHYYNAEYLLQVDGIELHNERNALTVQVISQVDDALLQVVCTDTYGNSATSPVINGVATFMELNPNTRYTVKVEAKGHHKLTGNYTDSFTTPAQTQILSFTATMGPEDCSVALNFTVSGPEPQKWTVVCTADGQTPQSVDFTGRSVIIRNLVAGANYTFTLTSQETLYISGKHQVSFVATKILYAQDLSITACGNGSLTATWAQPEDGNVTEWQVRCHNESGYNVTITTTELSYTFTGLDHSTACTVEVTAIGMNQSAKTSISANPVTVSDFACSLTDEMALAVSWKFSAQLPVTGWILRYSINEGEEQVLSLEHAQASIIAIPGVTYHFTLETADGSYVFSNTYSFATDGLLSFAGYGVTAENMTWNMFLWPSETNFKPTDIPAEDYRSNYTIGQAAGFLIVLPAQPEAYRNTVSIRYVLHDANGQVLSIADSSLIWKDMWQDACCLLPIPAMPETAGEYILSIYFDGSFVHQQMFSIAEDTAVEDGNPEEPGI